MKRDLLLPNRDLKILKNIGLEGRNAIHSTASVQEGVIQFESTGSTRRSYSMHGENIVDFRSYSRW